MNTDASVIVDRITEVMNLPDNTGKGLALTGKGYMLLHRIRADLAALLATHPAQAAAEGFERRSGYSGGTIDEYSAQLRLDHANATRLSSEGGLTAAERKALDATHPFDDGAVNDVAIVCRALRRLSGAVSVDEGAIMANMPSREAMQRAILADEDGEPEASSPLSRFFIDHGIVHDRKTGQHLRGTDEFGCLAADLLAVLQELEAVGTVGAMSRIADAIDRAANEEADSGFRIGLHAADKLKRTVTAALQAKAP